MSPSPISHSKITVFPVREKARAVPPSRPSAPKELTEAVGKLHSNNIASECAACARDGKIVDSTIAELTGWDESVAFSRL